MDAPPPIDHSPSPVRAVKVSSGCQLVDGELHVAPVGMLRAGAAPASGAHARCLAATPCHGAVPGWECHCGFWACRSARQLAGALGRPLRFYDVVLHVELWGRVVEHQRGWRAAHQRVVRVEFPKRCSRCGRRRGVRLCVDDHGQVRPRCARCQDGAHTVELEALGVDAGWTRAPRLTVARRRDAR